MTFLHVLEPASGVPVSTIRAVGTTNADPQMDSTKVTSIPRKVTRKGSISTFWVLADVQTTTPGGAMDLVSKQAACSQGSLSREATALEEA